MASTTNLDLLCPCSSLPSVPRWTYDVFLSFRGEDTRMSFTDHLHATLIRTGIIVFRDYDRLKRGKEIGPEVSTAIEQSRFAVVVMSPNYASSTWCLKELVKILLCSEEMGLKILPIFYGVDPSDVRKQKKSFEEAFAHHEKDNSVEVEGWRRAMTQFGKLSGLTSQNRQETELIKEIVRLILDELSHTFPTITKGLVGMDSHMKKMNELFGEGLNDVRLIGICGMGGIGKSTIARVYYDRVRWQFEGNFEGSCLINVKEVFESHGAIGLQEQLLSQILRESNIKIWDTQSGMYEIKKRLQHMKMLVILDNVDNIKQLEVLGVELDWFHSGSRIIITTRDQHLLRILRDDRVYKLQGLNDDDALTLFRMKAFKQDQPIADSLYEDLSRRVVGYAKGLPLALEVYLHGKSAAVWEDAIARLNKIPNKEIHDVLRISYDGLGELVKKIFLDIACFFKGQSKDRVTRILNYCGFHAVVGLDDLNDKSLISINQWNEVEMHDLLQAMGREIVRLQSTEEPGRRSRLWAKDDVFDVLLKNRGGEQVEGIFLKLDEMDEPKWNEKAFSTLKNLRKSWILVTQNTLPRFQILLGFQILKSLGSSIGGLEYLKTLDLNGCCKLVNIPDHFEGLERLEKLDMGGTAIRQVPLSIFRLKNLKELSLRGLNGEPPNLVKRHFSKWMTKYFPVSRNPIGLVLLSLRGLSSLRDLDLSHYNLGEGALPSDIGSLTSLEILYLGHCNLGEGALPSDIGTLTSLKILGLSGNDFVSLPTSINKLSNLRNLFLNDCKMLESLRQFRPPHGFLLFVNGCDSLQEMPDSMNEGFCIIARNARFNE